MNNLQVFTNETFGEIRTLEENGKVLFCGTDIAKVLGYTNPQKAIRDHCKVDGVAKRSGVSYTTNQYGTTTAQTVEMNFITEANVYRLITHSKLPSAEKFESWVFDEVLPSIRKHGMYAVDELIANPDLGIAALTALKEERAKTAKLETTVAVQEQQISELKPKASYYDVVLNCKDLLSATEIAKDYGKSAKWLNEFLREHGVQFKQSGVWLLYQKYAEKGYTSTKTHNYLDDNGGTHSKVHTYWTQKGRLFIYDLLKSHEILPTMERAA